MNLQKIRYADLNARQKEAYNFQKVSARLADFGFNTIRLSDDWQGADFIAQHLDGQQFLKVQLKGRLLFSRKYAGKDIYICFYEEGHWYLVPHDEMLEWVLDNTAVGNSKSWKEKGEYHFPGLPAAIEQKLQPFRLE